MKIMTIPILCGELPKFLGAICYEGDQNVGRLEFTGAEAGVQYKLDLQKTDGTKNVLDLVNKNGTLILTLDESVRIPAGRYQAQLRTVGHVVWHSNKAFLTVKDSINAADAFGQTIPTEMAQMEQRMTQMANHPPIPGENGFWMLWDTTEEAYAESAHPVQSSPVFVAEYGKTSYSELLQAWNEGKVLFCKEGDYLSAFYRYKADTYFSFKTISASEMTTRFCKPSEWDVQRQELASDKLKELEKRIAELEKLV